MKKSKRRVREAPTVPVAPAAFDWRDVAAAAWVAGVLVVFLRQLLTAVLPS
jgi:hypothetical protein